MINFRISTLKLLWTWSYQFQNPFHIYLNFHLTTMQVIQCLIDLGALQPTGDLSAVRIWSTFNHLQDGHSTVWNYDPYLYLIHFIIWSSGEEICTIFLGQSSKPVTRSRADIVCNWGGTWIFSSFGWINFPNYLQNIWQFYYWWNFLAGFVCNSTRPAIPVSINLHLCY